MSDYLVVPIKVDALYIGTPTNAIDAMANFSRLPHIVKNPTEEGLRRMAHPDRPMERNPDEAYISEAVVASPFGDRNFLLSPGIHLHWAMPDALVVGTHGDGGKAATLEFPAVPNRWLVTRNAGGQPQKRWIVESDYLWPVDSHPDAITYPLVNPGDAEPPWRYMGRALPAGNPDLGQGPYLNESLTAMGYGEKNFHSFYPNCFSVFGFCDEELAGGVPDTLYYEVVGWYSQDAVGGDPIAALKKESAEKPVQERIEERFGWEVSQDQPAPGGLVCRGDIRFGEGEGPISDSMEVVVGSTGTEALAAYLSGKAVEGNATKEEIENNLEALILSPRIRYHHADLLPKLAEARHEKSFMPIPGGTQWIVRPRTGAANSSPASSADASESPLAKMAGPLPPKLRDQLDVLNRLQRIYDRGKTVITELREQIYGDWYRYMICVYHPPQRTGRTDVFPDADAVRALIESERLLFETISYLVDGSPKGDVDKALEAAAESTDSKIKDLKKKAESYVNVFTAELLGGEGGDAISDLWTTDGPQSIKEAIDAARKDAAEKLAEAAVVEMTLQADLELVEIAAPRFWRPNDPVVLLAGDRIKSSDRHGEDGKLECPNCDLKITAEKGPEAVAPKGKGPGAIGLEASNRETDGKPWHPLYLEWEAEIEPLDSGGNLDPENRAFDGEFFKNHFTLETGPELQPADINAQSTGSTSKINGRSVISPYASTILESLIDEFSKEPKDPERSAALKEVDTVLEGVKTMIGEQRIQTQSLTGFHEALLMRRETLQLRISDPLGFTEYQDFTGRIRESVGSGNPVAPEPNWDFFPIRTGQMKLISLRVVDTFGQTCSVTSGDIDPFVPLTTTAQLSAFTNGLPNRAGLPPRLSQPARVSFRWLSGDKPEQQAHTHHSTGPICGWIVPNNLDESLAFYDSDGTHSGSISATGWKGAPGSDRFAVPETAINNPKMRSLATWLLNSKDVSGVIQSLDESLEKIDPENFAQHESQAILMGRPIAVVRASVNVELKGYPAIHQGWSALRRRLGGGGSDLNDYTQVELLVRIGEEHQLNDGVVAFWKEEGGGLPSPKTPDPIHFPQLGPCIFDTTLDAPPVEMTMLMDPRCLAHCTTGIFPTKAISIPTECYAAALQQISVTFLTSPILTSAKQVELPLPVEPGYQWSWVENDADGWKTIKTPPIPQKPDNAKTSKEVPPQETEETTLEKDETSPEKEDRHLIQVSESAGFGKDLEVREGWLKLSHDKTEVETVEKQ